jgi:hypothetical protein
MLITYPECSRARSLADGVVMAMQAIGGSF